VEAEIKVASRSASAWANSRTQAMVRRRHFVLHRFGINFMGMRALAGQVLRQSTAHMVEERFAQVHWSVIIPSHGA
jgi:hypothetical protein